MISTRLYTQALGYFNSLDKPAMFTPGDNDWTDCDRPSNGGFNSLERLDHERAVLFSTPFSLWKHTQGSCNNLCDTNPDPAEFAGRNQADIAWLQQTFADAKAKGSSAVMLISQADPAFDLLKAVRNATIDFRGPVAYVHGNSHYFRVDHPLLDTQGPRPDANACSFVRCTLPGAGLE